GHLPSDCLVVRLTQSDIDWLFASHAGIEDLYPLSPIQTLFVSANQGGVETTFDQWQCALHGELDVIAFQRAWQDTVARHPILRTTIHSEILDEPVQLVHSKVTLPWTVADWRSTPPQQHEAMWADYLKQDRARPFKLTEPPAMRFALIRLAQAKWKFVWSVPALLMDGWSWPLVFSDASRLYESATTGEFQQLG